MTTTWRAVVAGTFLAGIILTGMVGTTVSMAYVWPAYGLLGLAGVIALGQLTRRLQFTPPRGALLATIGLCAYLGLRILSSPVAYFAREDGALLVGAFLAYGLFLTVLDSAAWRARLFGILAGLALLNLGLVAVQDLFLPHFHLLPHPVAAEWEAGRSFGFFAEAAPLAGFLAVLSPLWSALALVGRGSPLKRGLFGALALGSAAQVMLSGVAPALLALLAGLALSAALVAVLSLPRWSGTAKNSAPRVAGAGAAILLLLLASPLAGGIQRALLTQDGRLDLVEVWKAGGEQVLAAPLLGTGSRTSFIQGRLFRSPHLDPGPSEPGFLHQEFLQMAADYGLVGLALSLLVLGLHLAGGWSFVRSYTAFPPLPGEVLPKSDHLAHVLGALGGLGALAAFASFEFALHLPIFVVLAAILLAVLAVPDPMADALRPEGKASPLPGGALVFSHRALLGGVGLAAILAAPVYTRSELLGERARRLFAADPAGFQHLPPLRTARSLDGLNPWLPTLAAHAQLAGIVPDMPEPARRQVLEQADALFREARRLYPQDVFAALDHSMVLDQLGRCGEALARIEEARRLAPLYGNLALAEAELHLRQGRVAEAEVAFAEAAGAAAFRDSAAAARGLRTVAEWRRLAEARGESERSFPGVATPPALAFAPERPRRPAFSLVPDRGRRPATARVEQRATAGLVSPATGSTGSTGSTGADPAPTSKSLDRDSLGSQSPGSQSLAVESNHADSGSSPSKPSASKPGDADALLPPADPAP